MIIRPGFSGFMISIMKPSNKDNKKTDDTPIPFRVMLDNLQEQMNEQILSFREIRSITLENQQLLRELLSSFFNNQQASTQAVSNRPSTSSSTRNNVSKPSTSVHNVNVQSNSAVGTSQHRSRSSTSTRQLASAVVRVNAYQETRQVIPRSQSASRPDNIQAKARSSSIAAQNEKVRNDAIPVPRGPVCWFHKQSGPKCQKCLPPCKYEHLVPKANHHRKVKSLASSTITSQTHAVASINTALCLVKLMLFLQLL